MLGGHDPLRLPRYKEFQVTLDINVGLSNKNFIYINILKIPLLGFIFLTHMPNFLLIICYLLFNP